MVRLKNNFGKKIIQRLSVLRLFATQLRFKKFFQQSPVFCQISARLIVLGLLTEIIYLLFYSIKPFKKYLGDIALTLSNYYLFLVVVGLLLTTLIIYVFAYKLVNRNNASLKIVIVFFVLFSLTLLFVWPIGSADVFSYIGWSRVLSEYQANPYIVPYSAFSQDAFYQTINNQWLSQTTPYGPLFVIISSALTFLGGDSLLCNLFLFKLFFIIINIANCFIIHKTFKNNKITFLYAWNPLILYEFAVNAHSDVLTIFFLLISLYFVLRKKNKLKNYILSWAFLLLSVLIKYMTLVILPIFFLVILFNIKKIKEKIFFSLISVLTSLFMFIVFFWPFFKTTQIFSTLMFYFMAPLTGAKMVGLAAFAPLLTVLLSFFLSYIKVINYYYWAVVFSKIIFIIFYCAMVIQLLIKRNRIKQEDIIKYSCLTLFIFLITFFTWVLPWYYTLLIVFMICCSAIDIDKFNKFVYGITLFSILYYVILR